jgi:anaerobic magnesium-protoporphyrin IX monomethyl ester cyclase
MKILLIYPYFLDPRLDTEDIQSPPMGVFYVAAVLKAHGHDVEVLNWHDRELPPERMESVLRAKRPQVIGFSILHANRWGGVEIARIAKRIDSAVTIVFGGVGATHLWEHFLKHFPEVDYIVLGEGENTFLKLVDRLDRRTVADWDSIAGIAFRKNGQPFRTAAPEPVSDLDALPLPAQYFDYAHLSLARGCVSNCRFCGSPGFWGHRVRYHSTDYFVKQLAALRQRGRRFFFVSDDTFTLNRRRVIAACRQMIQRRLDLQWAAISRVDAVDEEMLAWMRRAGCIQISYGVESGSAEIRRRLGKKISDRQIRDAFARTHRFGIMARAYFIYGCPGENPATIQATIHLMQAIQPLAAVFYILALFPGTALYEDFKRRCWATDDLWLRRVEDIMYFETDPSLCADQILEYGRMLRDSFYGSLPGFVQALDPIDQSDFYPLHADFFSRLAMTFDQGDYARIDAIPDKPQLAESLYRRALSYHPDARAYLGLGILNQKAGRHTAAADLLTTGLSHFPEDEPLRACLAVSLMNLERYPDALTLLERCPNQPQAPQLVMACRQAMR